MCASHCRQYALTRAQLILSFAAVVSFALSLYTDFGTEPERIPSPSCDGDAVWEQPRARAMIPGIDTAVWLRLPWGMG